ncbi:hypothetical protein ABG79_01490 [Caloramator mitchellensis]|uniref:Uncharacterized protein n=1 Tax=Caloramator mitchellensis TaxID=908809 RepID=A0A0R3K1I5_CALMK|nr:hypothetical protein [Caloramator mitchellensis]KRQ86738.1 hypothetical protein ABG79_01490 [Caloramator mitchellensis]
MRIYVDIDLDFLVKPIKQEGINNIRKYKGEDCTVSNVENFISTLNNLRLLKAKQKKFFTNHKKSYTYWWINRSLNNTLIHIDAHSDLYRNKQRDLTLLSDTDMNCDDYIWYAIRDGFIEKIYWVVPDDSYNLCDESVVKKFVPSDVLVEMSMKENQVDFLLEVITRYGIKKIQYTVLHLNQLPRFDSIDLLTVATSPEFYSDKADEHIFKALRLLGASEDEIKRIMQFHQEIC